MSITNRIHFRNVKGDIFGGITAAVIALPMALTFGVAAFGELPGGASAGLWGAILVGFFAALFGGTPTLISEPTGPMTVVMTAVIAGLTAANPEQRFGNGVYRSHAGRNFANHLWGFETG